MMFVPLADNQLAIHGGVAPAEAKDALAALTAAAAAAGDTRSTRDQATGKLPSLAQSTGMQVASVEERLERFMTFFREAPPWVLELVKAWPERLTENAELRRPASECDSPQMQSFAATATLWLAFNAVGCTRLAPVPTAVGESTATNIPGTAGCACWLAACYLKSVISCVHKCPGHMVTRLTDIVSLTPCTPAASQRGRSGALVE